MRGSRTEPVDVSSDGSADSGSNENLDSSSDGSGYSSSYEGASMSSDGVVYISSDEGKHISSDEGEYNSLDEGAYTSSDEDMSSSSDEGAHTIRAKGVHRRMKEKKPWKACMNICDCPKEYTVGAYNAAFKEEYVKVFYKGMYIYLCLSIVSSLRNDGYVI
ncbi:uncharacterized protein LOC125532059 isoform X1 [Triticum urartu]|uniref:uncharacterized protein LOC125521680 isoform X1 n=1 Tax=Triticum urartu TaxID=4572 RepID=UPI002043AFF7|nr:uncharacterized protein LOC125521680 isoform X1 [Triticum urartu]XP_048542692.1 uncharacterized protein LOC125521680 isoform X1 [Triticum urartu]XP_048552194.1 uncharacterized protein LOC125532059 isoform X1 [Triticum urartu]XP_048552195.1 uncharacterized protein LOC125532059 isoform X1 [Triticum urartu]